MTRDIYGQSAEVYRVVTTASGRLGTVVPGPIERRVYARLRLTVIDELKSSGWDLHSRLGVNWRYR